MTTVDFGALIERATQDEEFGSNLIGFAKAHGIEILTEEQLSEDQLDDVAGGLSMSSALTAPLRFKLSYTPKLLPGDQFVVGGRAWEQR